MVAANVGMSALPPRAPHNVGHLRGTRGLTAAMHEELKNAHMRENIGHTTRSIRKKCAHVVAEKNDWEQLWLADSHIKRDVMARLPELLKQFEESVTDADGHVHWARDVTEINHIIMDLVKETGEEKVIKIKSMATQEIGLNETLADAGITAHETDLAELIVQLADDMPSHILIPTIHRSREDICEIFLNGIPGVDPDLKANPVELAEASRKFLCEQFMEAKVAISGTNFGVVETGAVAVVESEGNGRMCLTLPETLTSVTGIGKLLPTFQDLEVFLQLLPRSSTGERMNPYTSLWTGTTDGNGPKNFHIVLLGNGRSATLVDPIGRETLECTHCSACLNICPVYEYVDGHAYGSVYPGPTGATLSSQLIDMDSYDDPNVSLPYVSSLCGACFEVCPVRIDILAALLELRHRKVTEHRPPVEGKLLATLGFIMGNQKLWNMNAKVASLARVLGLKDDETHALPLFLSGWSDVRDAPIPPKEPFRSLWDSANFSTQLTRESANQVPTKINGLSGSGQSGSSDISGKSDAINKEA